jgi:heptosyltransferase II
MMASDRSGGRDATADARPRTVVLHQYSGIGDFVWHMPYFERVAAQSQGGQVAVIASPTTFARQLLSGVDWVSQVIDHDNRPRRHEQRRGRHQGLMGIWRLAAELRPHRFERIVVFSSHANRGLLAWLAGIPQRSGYGFGGIQRLFLNQPPFIQPYRGPSVSVYKEAAAFAMAQGFCDTPLVPRVPVPPDVARTAQERLAGLPAPVFALGIGTSEPKKQWGAPKFAALAQTLIAQGAGVVVLGGPAEADVAREIEARLPAGQRSALRSLCAESVIGTAALLQQVKASISNDTGVANLAAAVACPSYVLLGDRPLLDQDPLMRLLRAPSLADVQPQDVVARLIDDGVVASGPKTLETPR